MAASKGLSTRRSQQNCGHYRSLVSGDSDDEANIELTPREKPRSVSTENGIELQEGTYQTDGEDRQAHKSETTGASSCIGDVLDRDYTDMAMQKSEKMPEPSGRRGADRTGTDHLDMATESSKDVAKGFKRRTSENRNVVYNFGWFDILIAVGSIIVFVVDITTDIKLAVDYFLEREWFYGSVTTALIVAPSLVTCCLGLHWYIIDYMTEKEVIKQSKKLKGHVHVTPRGMWFCRFFFTVLQCGPVVRTVEYLYYGCKSRSKKCTDKEKRRYHWWMLYEDVDNCLLRMFESFLESAPQLVFQLFVFVRTKPNEDVFLTTTRCLALVSSWGSLAVSLVSYHKSLRNSRDEKKKIGFMSMLFYFLWRASETGARVLCLAMFASAFDFWVFGIILLHWVVISGWLMNQRTTFYKNRCLERVFNIICGYVMLFCFLNLREGHTRFRFLVYYIIFYIENFFMLAFWFRFTPDLGAWFHLWGFITVLIFFVLHVFLQLLYYTSFHPSGEISYCLPCDSVTFYESVCYDIRAGVDDGVGSPNKKYTSRELVQNMPEVIVDPQGDAKNSCKIPQVKDNRQQRNQPTTYQERVDVHVSCWEGGKKAAGGDNRI